MSFEAKLYSIIAAFLVGQFFIPLIVSPIIFCAVLAFHIYEHGFYLSSIPRYIGIATLFVAISFAIAWFLGSIVLGQSGGYGGYKYDLL